MNPFEQDDSLFQALVNTDGQFSLWPAGVPVPDGWLVRYGPEPRLDCLAFIEKTWTDMRPAGLRPG